jgi:hypothetical protein
MMPALFDLAEIPLMPPFPLETRMGPTDFLAVYELYKKERIRAGFVPAPASVFAVYRRITIL